MKTPATTIVYYCAITYCLAINRLSWDIMTHSGEDDHDVIGYPLHLGERERARYK
jgi:hypothetical protein